MHTLASLCLGATRLRSHLESSLKEQGDGKIRGNTGTARENVSIGKEQQEAVGQAALPFELPAHKLLQSQHVMESSIFFILIYWPVILIHSAHRNARVLVKIPDARSPVDSPLFPTTPA